jgi:epoxide hydrolase
MIEPFQIAVDDATLDNLRARLDATRWPDELPGAAWARGVPLSYLKELTAYWRDDYDWREHEARLNALAQFTTEIDGQRFHFVHARSPHDDALPLLLSHGWPGSIVEFLDVVGPLTDPTAHGGAAADAFHVVAPSLPGYAFSTPLGDGGWDVVRIARAFVALMAQLDYARYGAQGGDWGAAISTEVGRADPEHVAGVHVNMLFTLPPSDPAAMADLSADEQAALAAIRHYRDELSGYRLQQATRPQTLAYGLTDSPVGQLAWIVEKFMDWTDSQDAPEDAVDRDLLLTNVMLYWLTATAGTSANLYYEAAHSGAARWPTPPAVPTGVAVFPKDIAQPIRRFAQGNIVRWTQMPRGGHFAAMEEPELLVDDVRAFFSALR